MSTTSYADSIINEKNYQSVHLNTLSDYLNTLAFSERVYLNTLSDYLNTLECSSEHDHKVV